MLTLFAIPKAFKGHIDVIQRNAIQSWKRLHPEIEIILFGSDEGTAEVAREFGLRHEPHVELNEYGSCLVHSMFAKVRAVARREILCYINCDIILLDDFCAALEQIKAAHREFLMVGRRTDVDIRNPWPFDRPGWKVELSELVSRYGKDRAVDHVDYFAFSRGVYGPEIPALAIGRAHWDNWAIWHVLDLKHAVVDASAVVTAVHQNHDYGHHPEGKPGVYYGEEAERNRQLAGGWRHLRTIADATEVLTPEKLKPNALRHWSAVKRYAKQAGRVLLNDVWHPVWFALLTLTRPLRRSVRPR
jgi:hypothetical protein